MTDSRDELRDPELRDLLRRATAADRPSEEALARVRLLAASAPGTMPQHATDGVRRRAEWQGNQPEPGFMIELMPRMASLLGILTLFLGALQTLPFGRSVEALSRASLPQPLIFLPMALVAVLPLFAIMAARTLREK